MSIIESPRRVISERAHTAGKLYGADQLSGASGPSGALEAGQGLDVLAEREKIEGGETREAQCASRCERRGILDQGLDRAAHVQQTCGRGAPQMFHEHGIEPFARRVGDDHVRAGSAQERVAGGPFDDADFGAVGGVELGEPEIEPREGGSARLVHGERAGAG